MNNKDKHLHKIFDSMLESYRYIAIGQTLQWIATYYVVSDIQPSEGYGAQIRLCSLDGWIFVFGEDGYELIYIKKNKKFENIRFLIITL